MCCRCSGLRPVCPALIGDTGSAAAGEPSPLLGRSVVSPKVVQNRTFGRACSRGIESESTEEPDIAGGIGPQRPVLAAAWCGGSGACPQSAVTAILIGYIGIGGPNPSPLFRCGAIFPQVIQQTDLAGRVVALAAEEPDIAGGIRGGWCSPAATRVITARSGVCLVYGRRDILRDIDGASGYIIQTVLP